MDTKSIGHQPDIRATIDPAKIRQAEQIKSDSKSSDRANKGVSKDFQLSLSSEALQLAEAREKAMQIAHDTSPIREARISELRDRINSGEYTINPEGIADGMLREAIRDELASNLPDRS